MPDSVKPVPTLELTAGGGWFDDEEADVAGRLERYSCSAAPVVPLPTLPGLMLTADDVLPVRHCVSDGLSVENVDTMGEAVEGRAILSCRCSPPVPSANGLHNCRGQGKNGQSTISVM